MADGAGGVNRNLKVEKDQAKRIRLRRVCKVAEMNPSNARIGSKHRPGA